MDVITNLGASRQEADAKYRRRVPFEGFKAAAISQGPQANRLITRSGDNALINGGELGGPNPPLVPSQRHR